MNARFARRAVLPVWVALAGLATLAACGGHSAEPAAPASRPVRVAPATLEALGDSIHAAGFLTQKDEARLSFKVGGVIATLRAEEGARIRAGQLLAELKQTEVAAGVEQARQTADKTRRDLARTRALEADGVATREQLEDATTAAALSAAALAATEFNASYARIVAPADGVVLRKLADVHELVQAGQPVLVVGGGHRGWVVRVGLADRDVVRVRLGDPARVSFDAWPDRVFAGHVTNLAGSADAGTGTFAIEVEVEPDGAAFAQGLVAKVVLTPATGRATTVIPVQALVEANGSEASLFVLDAKSGTARRVTVRIGRLSEGSVEVLEGLAPGTLVVVDGGAFLENGAPVHVAADAARVAVGDRS